jgi:hypothetical protein
MGGEEQVLLWAARNIGAKDKRCDINTISFTTASSLKVQGEEHQRSVSKSPTSISGVIQKCKTK